MEDKYIKAGVPANVELKQLGTLTRKKAIRLKGFKNRILIEVTKKITRCTLGAAEGDTCQVTVTKEYCQFIPSGGGHWVCYKVPKKLTGTYDAKAGCCKVTDPDDNAEYCVN